MSEALGDPQGTSFRLGAVEAETFGRTERLPSGRLGRWRGQCVAGGGLLLKGSLGRGVGGQTAWVGGTVRPCGHLVWVRCSPGEWRPRMGFQQGSCESGCFGKIFFSSPDCCVGNKWGEGSQSKLEGVNRRCWRSLLEEMVTSGT